MRNTVIAIPYYGARDADHMACVRELEKMGLGIITVDGCPYVDMARAFLAKTALDINADVVVFIDHDITFTASDVLDMADRLRASEYGVLGALYAYRNTAGGLIGKIKDPPREGSIEFFVPGLIDADFLGMGFTAIKASTFEALKPDCPLVMCPTVKSEVWPFFMNSVWPDGYHGEDLSFCRRVQKRGIKLGIDKQPRIFHKGNYRFGLEDAALQCPRFQVMEMNFNFV